VVTDPEIVAVVLEDREVDGPDAARAVHLAKAWREIEAAGYKLILLSRHTEVVVRPSRRHWWRPSRKERMNGGSSQ
jgi:hypothetical protein